MMSADEFDFEPVQRVIDGIVERQQARAASPDARYVCRYCGLSASIAQLGDHWLRHPDHSPDYARRYGGREG